MFRILSFVIGIAAAAIILFPVFIILKIILFHNIKDSIIFFIFAVYMASVYVITGLPGMTSIQLDLSFSLVPFIGMISDIKNSILNAVLFIPLGFMLPFLNDRFRRLKCTLLFGLCLTLTIEILQIFTFRLTDINDIIINLSGTVTGYYISVPLINKLTFIAIKEQKGDRLCIVCVIVFIAMFFFQPFVSDIFWDLIFEMTK